MIMIAGLTLERVLAMADHDRFRRLTRNVTRIYVAVAALLLLAAVVISLSRNSIEPRLLQYVAGHMAGSAFADGNAAWMADRVRNTLTAFSLSSWTLWGSIISIGIAVYGLRVLLTRERRGLTLLVTGTSLQLLIFAFNWLPISDATQYPLFPRTAAIDSLSSLQSRVFVDRHLYIGHQYLFLDNSNVIYGVRQISGFESLLPRSFYVALNKHGYDTLHTLPSLPLLSALNVGRIVTGDWISLRDSTLSRSSVDGLNIYTNHLVKPRVWLGSSARVASDSNVLSLLFEGPFDTNTAYLAESDAASALDTTALSGDARIVHDEPEDITIATNASRACYLVMSDTYYPGWEATIDGRDAQIERANYAMRAVRIPPGRREIVMRFRPLSFELGCYGSLAGILVSLVLLAFGRSRPRSGADRKHREANRT
jgi:hypothetical protein